MNKKKNALLLTVLAVGAVWGLSEVLLGGVLGRYAHTLKGGLLTGVGLGLVGIFIAMFGKPLYALAIGLMTIITKQLVVPILGVSITCKANSCLAVMLSAGAIAAAASLFRKKSAITGASAGLSAAVAFYFLGMGLRPCPYLLSFNGKFFYWVLMEGVLWAGFSAILYPIGVAVGERLKSGAFATLDSKPALFYRTTTAITVFSLLLSAAAIYIGI